MEKVGTYKGNDEIKGMEFTDERHETFWIYDGEMPLKIGTEYKIIAHGFDVGSYGDDLVITDYEIEESKILVE